MRTQKQIDASRENGRKSQGAATAEGKTLIVNARLQHGIYAEQRVLRWEQAPELQKLKDEYYTRHPPASPEARCLLDQIVLCEWHLRRFCCVEDAVWNGLVDAATAGGNGADPRACAALQGDQVLYRLQHRLNSTRRAFVNALKELERLEARDRDVVLVDDPAPAPANHSPESDLPILGSFRKNPAGEPEAA